MSRGFTLVELIIVIVITSILAVGSVRFISFSAQGLVDTASRSDLSSLSLIASEKLKRQLVNALPNSIRTNSSGNCLEWIPILAASEYVQAPFIGSPDTKTEVHLLTVSSELPDEGRLVIYPSVNNADTLYDISRNPGRISNNIAVPTSVSSDVSVYQFASGAEFQFERTSPQKRIFIVDEPKSICQQGTQLFLYESYGFNSSANSYPTGLPSTIPNRVILANKLVAGSIVFRYLPMSLRRNALVGFSMEFRNDEKVQETLLLTEEVQIRNVP
ncbi:prepilin-type N-terminal cleavage/methylation domain-containing protein [Bermanella marisrubri]|uniref:MSHA biogenesis protein MshO n=1 Tax=Bermanella marisrubri TaxID=207949 RepID=Q1N2G8_9GAMM|nr:prepilin-type N-terminal cleavage/methylation domain-containing protein [Bermanella marisrubri]EAT12439.1 hypothetical protein RED65_16416 [Oceanobacter sp. RED65] [Bermanella marisrubri]QIZ85519.1 prepilin-type N-terminal cleavage/methylation domain-containing protein [Bermanella marisrubri]